MSATAFLIFMLHHMELKDTFVAKFPATLEFFEHILFVGNSNFNSIRYNRANVKPKYVLVRKTHIGKKKELPRQSFSNFPYIIETYSTNENLPP